MEKVGSKLRNLRKERGYSQENIDEELGISPSTLSRIENDHEGTKWIVMNQLCDLYKVPISQLLSPFEKRLIIKEEILKEILKEILEKIYEDKLEFFLERLHEKLISEFHQIVASSMNKPLEK